MKLFNRCILVSHCFKRFPAYGEKIPRQQPIPTIAKKPMNGNKVRHIAPIFSFVSLAAMSYHPQDFDLLQTQFLYEKGVDNPRPLRYVVTKRHGA